MQRQCYCLKMSPRYALWHEMIKHLHTPTHTYTHLHTPTHTYTHLHTPTYTYTHVLTPTHTYTHLHTRTYTYTHLHTRTYTYTHLHTHVLTTRAYIYIFLYLWWYCYAKVLSIKSEWASKIPLVDLHGGRYKWSCIFTSTGITLYL